MRKARQVLNPPLQRSQIGLTALAAVILAVSGCTPAGSAPLTSAGSPTQQPPTGERHAAADDAPAPSSSITPQPSSSMGPAKSVAPPTDIPIQSAGVRPAQELPAPTSLTIAGTDIDVKILEVGIAENNAMELPEGFHKAGWYKYGPAPGEDQGHAVIAGHVDSLTEVMPFAELEDVETGTVVTVERENALPVRYRVSRVEHAEKATLSGSDLFARDGQHRLKVVTCGGDWLPEREDYEDNVVLTAVPL